ncbi:MAG: response regulator [Thaumarchaeota archaeon]|nr:response regulator [Nitrososphaerota archaeon]
MRAIVIDDDNDTVSFFSEYLEIMGIQVVGRGYDGKNACDLYARLRPDVVFMDVMMPCYDGFYGLEGIKKLDGDAKVIMVTADLTAETEDKLERLEASAVVFKPFKMEKVMETMRNVCSLRRLKVTHV